MIKLASCRNQRATALLCCLFGIFAVGPLVIQIWGSVWILCSVIISAVDLDLDLDLPSIWVALLVQSRVRCTIDLDLVLDFSSD